jgi:nucleotidyltransferase substrate binding protein (TIGR01987 family)
MKEKLFMQEKIQRKLSNLDKALQRLQSAINQPMDEQKFMIEATMQCFEFCYELLWKTLKACLEKEGIQADTPRQVFQEAYQVKWLGDETTWLQMMKDRNTTSHVYDAKTASTIYANIKKYHDVMKEIFNKLKMLYE